MSNKNKLREELAQWTEALESGKYKQASSLQSQLYSIEEGAYCCLGVLAKIMGNDEAGIKGYGYLHEAHTKVRSELITALVNSKNIQPIFSVLNDYGFPNASQSGAEHLNMSVLRNSNPQEFKCRCTFEQIAGIIRENEDNILQVLCTKL